MQHSPPRSAVVLATDPYCDRGRLPAETVAMMRPHFAQLGITRIGRQTGLDRIGIPCFAAFRPNSQSLATNQGKGLTDDAASASAVMEATEFAIAEKPQVGIRRADARSLSAKGFTLFNPTRWLPFGEIMDDSLEVDWFEGFDLHSQEPVQVPADLVRMNAAQPDLPGICRNTNGLASGNFRDEAVFHGLCELIERDGTTLWSLLAVEEQHRTSIDIAGFSDPIVARLDDQIRGAGFELKLFDQTSDLGIPVIMAVLGPRSREAARHFEVSAGYGAHPVAARAAIRAITEAAQSRITVIAGSRDDINPSQFDQQLEADVSALLDVPASISAPSGLPLGTPPAQLATHLGAALQRGHVDAVVVPLGGETLGISVVKVLSTTLEDREPNTNWRPGPRALSLLLGG